MSELVERVARAIDPEAFGLPSNLEDGTITDRDEARDRARAAIAAMREPTEAMLIGAQDWSIGKHGRGVGNDDATACWQAMIAAALK